MTSVRLYPQDRGGWLRTAFVQAWSYVIAFQIVYAEAGGRPEQTVRLQVGALVLLPLPRVAGFLISQRLASSRCSADEQRCLLVKNDGNQVSRS